MFQAGMIEQKENIAKRTFLRHGEERSGDCAPIGLLHFAAMTRRAARCFSGLEP
jgi:hypothetical protein